jgi:hypothetical protein
MAATTQWDPTEAPGKTLSVAQIKKNIDTQLDVSKEIFQLVPKLAEIVENRPKDQELSSYPKLIIYFSPKLLITFSTYSTKCCQLL